MMRAASFSATAQHLGQRGLIGAAEPGRFLLRQFALPDGVANRADERAFDPQLSERVAIYFSRADQVLQLSMVVNLGAKRLGQDGPHNRADPNAFPPGQFTMKDCTDARDFDFEFMTSHQYYRLSPQVRTAIAGEMAGPVVV
jgi:esterase/lipase superfamily enzyme